MLKIRKEQIDVFEQAALCNFEDLMVEHLKQFAPKHAEVLGEPRVRQVITLGMERARKYGFTNQGPVRFYLELMFMFGSDFDTDPQLPWAHETLKDAVSSNQMALADELYDKAMDYFNRVVGPNYEYEIAALHKVSRERYENLPRSDRNFGDEVAERLRKLYPQKCDYLGELKLRLLIPRASELAEKYSVTDSIGESVFIGLMFALGHGCTADPQFPWIEATLRDAAIGDPNKCIERLYGKFMTYLNTGLANLEQR